jgi:hypothetical protein
MREREWLTLTEALAWLMAHMQTDGLRNYLSQREAWRELRGAAADGVVRIRGARQERRGDNPLWEPPDDARPIPPETVEALLPVCSSDGSLVLVAEAQARFSVSVALDLFPVVAWVAVTVSRSDLERVFLPSASVPTLTLARRKPGRTDKKADVVAAFWAEFPDGRPSAVSKRERNNRIKKRLQDEGHRDVFDEKTLRTHLKEVDP